MEITIHRGANEIGGTCIRLTSGGSTILLDLGQPLSGDAETLPLEGVPIDGVLISHPHMDHYGLIDVVDEDVPVYIGGPGKDLIDATRLFLRKELHRNRFVFFEKWVPFRIGPFTITPYLVDHSAADAYAFLIEAEGKRIFYSGDFRAHGRKRILYDRILENPPGRIDALFMEGTMLGRPNDRFPDEESVERRILEKIAGQENVSFVITSSQNIDRLVSIYRACRRAGRILVLDFYTAWVLEMIGRVSPGVRAMEWGRNMAIHARHGHDEAMKNRPEIFSAFRREKYRYRVKPEEIKAEPSRYVECIRMSSAGEIASYKSGKTINLIYSQWEGYLRCGEKGHRGAETVAAYRDGKDPDIHYVYAHTSGHAVLEDLKSFAEALKPSCLIPIHTEHRAEYRRHFDAVRELEDGETLLL